jgi:hypothetical protein
MTTPVQPDPGAGARFLAELLAGDPARLDVATDEQVVAMMDAADVQAPEAEGVEQVLARGERRARERATRARGLAATKPSAAPRKATSRAAWAAGALVAAAAAAVVAVEVSGSHGGQEAVGPDAAGLPPEPWKEARRLRDEALAACSAQDLATCGKKLDEAKALDPAGEADARVVEARKLLTPAQVPTPTPTPVPSEPLKYPKPL